jgi:hypothetical protein
MGAWRCKGMIQEIMKMLMKVEATTIVDIIRNGGWHVRNGNINVFFTKAQKLKIGKSFTQEEKVGRC